MSAAYTAIQRDNATRRRRADEAGKPTYRKAMIDDLPACVVCDTPIRLRGLSDYTCGCIDVKWRPDWGAGHGWVHH